eukprot:1138805-Pelagomonas_calceolata.AAC.2
MEKLSHYRPSFWVLVGLVILSTPLTSLNNWDLTKNVPCNGYQESASGASKVKSKLDRVGLPPPARNMFYAAGTAPHTGPMQPTVLDNPAN